MSINQFYLTTAGRRLLAKVQTGEVLSFTSAAIGDGEPRGVEFIESMTSLVSERNRFPIVEVKDNGDGTVYIKSVFTNDKVKERYFIKEIGIYARDPAEGEILYAVCSCGEASDLFSANTDKELSIIMQAIITIGNAKNVTFVIDDSLVWATKQELYDLAGVGRTSETVKKNADDILALKLLMMMGNINQDMGNLDENSILVKFTQLKEDEEFWGFWDKARGRLVG